MKTKSKIITILQGQAGVHRVASELMLRGYHVCFPAADLHGIDLMLESGVRIQVKSANMGFYERTPYGAYWFNFGQSKYNDDLKKIVKVKRDYSSQCDFVVLFGIDESKFWVVPAKAFDGANMCVMGREPNYCDYSREQLEEMQKTGLTHSQIATKIGVDQSTVTRRINGKFANTRKRGRTDFVRNCENTWHLIHELELSRQPQGKLIEMPKVESAAS